MDKPQPEEGHSGEATPQEQSITETGRSLLDTLRTLAADLMDLVAMELRLAGLSLATMLALGVALGVLLVTAWLLVIGAIAAWIVLPDTTWGATFALMAVFSVGAAIGLVVLIRARSRNLLFSRTRRQLSPRPNEPAA